MQRECRWHRLATSPAALTLRSYRVVSCRVVSCRVVSCRVVSCRVVSCRVVSCRVVSCRVVSYLACSIAKRCDERDATMLNLETALETLVGLHDAHQVCALVTVRVTQRRWLSFSRCSRTRVALADHAGVSTGSVGSEEDARGAGHHAGCCAQRARRLGRSGR